MRIMICCSKRFYDQVGAVRDTLEARGHEIILPNSYEDPLMEEKVRAKGDSEHTVWKAEMLRLQGRKIAKSHAIIVLNFEKDGQLNYIGGATFLEIFKAFELSKMIFLWNDVPQSIFTDELLGMSPVLIGGDLLKIVGTIQERMPHEACSDCRGVGKVMFIHSGLLVSDGLVGKFCPECWVDRQVHYSHFGTTRPLGHQDKI